MFSSPSAVPGVEVQMKFAPSGESAMGMVKRVSVLLMLVCPGLVDLVVNMMIWSGPAVLPFV